jgi:AcrR family transcriptional regulator
VTAVSGRAERAELEGGARRLILDHAARLLRSNGYHQTSLREIAEAVGIRKASLYHHFRSKEEIVEAVVNDGVRLVLETVLYALEVAGEATPRQRLKAAIAAHLTALHGHSDYTCASIKVFSFGENPTPESVRRTRRAYDDLWRALVDELATAGVLATGIAPERLRLFLLGAMNGSVDWYREGRFDIAQLAGELAALVAPAEES